ncbi:MAG: tetratricopeptide repeat protein [Bacteroidales bacterium]
MKIKEIGIIAGLLVVSAVIGTNLGAQVGRNDVITAYNEGAKAMQTDTRVAIDAFEKVITLSDQVGEEAADLRQKAVQVLPGLYCKVAAVALNEKKPAAEIIKASKTAVIASEKYGSVPNQEKARKILSQGYNAMGADFFSKNDYENAIRAFDSLLVVNPDYLNAYYNKALIYIKQDNADAFEGTMDLYLEKLKSTNDTVKIQKASQTALEYFRSSGSKANQANKLDDALVLLNKAAKYGNDKDLFYYFADVYNKQKKFNSGAEYAQKGLDLETGAAEAKAKFYYQLAVAQAGNGLTAEACASFKNAMYGPFIEASKAQRTNLKCD